MTVLASESLYILLSLSEWTCHLSGPFPGGCFLIFSGSLLPLPPLSWCGSLSSYLWFSACSVPPLELCALALMSPPSPFCSVSSKAKGQGR